MRSFFSSNKFKFISGIFAALLLGLFIAALSGNGVTPLTRVVSMVMRPLTAVCVQIEQGMKSFSAGFVSANRYQEEISSLQDELESCRSQLVDYEKIQKQLNAYEKFLEIKEQNPDYSFVPATVILRDASNRYTSFTVNKGSKDGVTLHSPVISGDNLVGAVKELTEHSAVVYTLFSPSVNAAAYEIRTREDCYTENDPTLTLSQLIRVAGLSRSTPVVTGGIVCTSGIGGKFPKDLIIGTVTEVISSENDISTYALVSPNVDFSELTDVFIITDFDGKTE